MKTSDLFVKTLEKHWVETIYWVPGEENLDFLESLRKSKIKLILTRNEQTAVFMAATFGRLTGKIGVAIATLWPWATNMVTGVAYAQLGGMPVMVITGQKPIQKSKQGQFQIIDVVGMMKPITKFATSIVSPSKVAYTVNNAIRIAEDEKPGAVHIELPEDVAAENIANKDVIDIDMPVARRTQIDDKMFNLLKSEIEKAKAPVILVGGWANRKRITKYLTKFIKKHNIPYFCSQMGKWVVDGENNNYLGTAALTSGDYIHKALAKSDLIIAVGYDPVEKPTQIIEEDETKLIHINFYSADIDLVYTPYMEAVWDIGHTLWRLHEADIDTSKWNFDAIYKISEKNKVKVFENEKLEQAAAYMMPRRLARELRESLADEDILTLDNGLYKVWIARNYPARKPNTLLLDNALATMWAGLPSAMEAKRLNPDKQVVCVTGDGGLVMNLWDIETAVRMKLDLTIIVLNNSSYGMIKWKQGTSGFGDFWLDFGNPDFVKLAKSFWANGHLVERKENFKSTLKKAMNESGVSLIELVFDYPRDGKIM